ncbi:MAG: serine/threonine-protein kinase [Blautia sp.]|nr:serine/threonine-protein kinase [Blautia sp.]MDY5030426.1 serine/threonine-protein kinase [Blautia sp.]
MDVNKLCFGCMKEKENPGQRCSYCGFDLNEYMQKCSARALRPGTILNGQYLVGKVLGEGGFGVTYLAYDLNLRLPVAIKEYFPVGLAVRDISEKKTDRISAFSGEKQTFYEKGLESFTEEARSLIRFRRDDGIVQVNTFFYENGTAYMVMEYIRGKSLKQYLQEKNAPLSERETMEIMRPVLEELEKVHETGIIHRDISPDNIMLGEDGNVYLIDFGAARMITGAETRSLEVVLKPGYTPFEQYHSRGKMGPWTDVYAVCATMYRMLSGKVPQEALSRLEEDEVEPLWKLAERKEILPVSKRLSLVIEKGMSLKREDRYPGINELLKDLTEKEKAVEKSVASEKKQKEEKVKEEKIHKERHKEKVEKKHSRKKYLIAGGTAAVLLIFVSGFGMWSHPELFRSAEKCYELGCEYYEKEDYQKAYKLLKKAADAGNTDAQYQLGNCYYEGTGVEQNTETAIELYEEAAEEGNEDARNSLSEICYSLGNIYYDKTDYEKAVEWYKKASDAGNADAQYYLGRCYYTGTGVDRNTETAIELFEKSAAQENADALYQLGYRYYSGNGVEVNRKKALELFKKAADLGNASAQLFLGNCYRFGIGVKQDFEMAKKYLEKAAIQGKSNAKRTLELMD